MMKTLRQIYEEIEPQANASANSLILIDKLRKTPAVMQMLQQIDQPTDKYKAIMKFAALLGVPEQRFPDFVNQQSNIVNQ